MTRRGGGALLGLGVIVLTTVAWWALALVPLGPTAPDWLARTREVCFGAGRDSLPHAGGWLLLVGEPLGMLAALLVGWRDALRDGVAWLGRSIQPSWYHKPRLHNSPAGTACREICTLFIPVTHDGRPVCDVLQGSG